MKLRNSLSKVAFLGVDIRNAEAKVPSAVAKALYEANQRALCGFRCGIRTRRCVMVRALRFARIATSRGNPIYCEARCARNGSGEPPFHPLRMRLRKCPFAMRPSVVRLKE